MQRKSGLKERMRRAINPIEVAKQVAISFYRAKGYYPVRIKDQSYKCDPYHIGTWRNVSNGKWEPETYNILAEFLSEGMVYLDLGAWIGTTALFASRYCEKVICFEPDIEAFHYLCWNMSLNNTNNISAYNVAISGDSSIMRMGAFGGNLGDSTSSLLRNDADADKSIEVVSFSWEYFLKLFNMPQLDFVKMDIEGGEFLLVPEMKNYLVSNRPFLYISIHAPFLSENSRRPQMKKLIDVLECYENCVDEKMNRFSIENILSDECMNTIQTLFFW